MLAAPTQHAAMQQRRRQPQHGAQGPRVPNLFWRSHHTDALRLDERYVALQPEADVKTWSSLRYVRQGSDLWHRAHAGRVTTGGLLAALGWRHEKAAARIHLHKNMRGPEYLQAAYTHLLAGEDPELAATLSAAAGQAGEETAAAADVGNEARRSEYNASLRGTTPPAVSSANRRAISEQAALGGTLSVRLAWGKVQEAAALYAVIRLFPGSILEEVGMFVPSARQLAAALANGGGGEDGTSGGCGSGGDGVAASAAEAANGRPALPPLGASPDGILCHRLRFSVGEVREAARALSAGRRGDAARGLLAAGLSRAARGGASAHASSSSGSSGGGTGEAWSAARRGAHTASPCEGLCGPSVEEQLAAFIESATGLLDRGSAGSSGAGSGSGQGGGIGEGGGGVSSLGEDDLWPGELWVREVVEVKSHCPFVMKGRRRGRKGAVVVDCGMGPCSPVSRLQPAWVPQLQMHMLCTGCATALLVSRTPDNGVRVFRVWRDDRYLSLLLAILGTLQSRHVATGSAPGSAAFLAVQGQSEALSRTAEIARRATVIAESGCGAAGGGSSGAGSAATGETSDDGESGLEAGVAGLSIGAEEAGAALLRPPLCADGSNGQPFWA